MRTRQRTLLVNPSGKHRLFYPDTKTNGYTRVLPYWMRDGGLQSFATTSSLQNSYEYIVDDPKKTDSIKYVNHIKLTTSKLEPLSYVFPSTMADAGVYPAMPSGWTGARVDAQAYWIPSFYWKDSIYAYSVVQDQITANARFADFRISNIATSDPYSTKGPTASSSTSVLPSKIIKRLESVHLSTTIYESRELPELYRWFKLRSNILKFPQIFNQLRRSGSFRSVKEWLRFWRENQLGYTFGLLPTVRDVQQISAELSKKTKPRNTRFVVTDRSVKTSQVNEVWRPTGAYVTSSQANAQDTFEHVSIAGARVTENRPRVDYGYFSKAADFVDSYVGKNPLGLIWEVLPLSFAIDWLISVDDVLDTLWLNSQSQYKIEYWTSSRKSIKRRVIVSLVESFDEVKYVNPQFQMTSIGSYTQEWTNYVRTPVGAPSPIDSVRLRGANTYNLYLSLLIASGLVKRK